MEEGRPPVIKEMLAAFRDRAAASLSRQRTVFLDTHQQLSGRRPQNQARVGLRVQGHRDRPSGLQGEAPSPARFPSPGLPAPSASCSRLKANRAVETL